MTGGRARAPEPPIWDPEQYLRFEAPRLRPALDLLGRIRAEAPSFVCDLGCGTGNVAALLRRRWPDARIMAVDNAPSMLAAARRDHGEIGVEWVEADISSWRPERPPDVILSNAALHWLDRHAELFPRLAGLLAEGGWLAVQMPRNFDAPSHTAIEATIEEGPWARRLRGIWRPAPVRAPEDYHRLLSPHVEAIDIWETTYLHRLTGPDPVLEWTRGTALAPILSVLDEPERQAFVDAYAARLRAAYPQERDGTVLFPFRRLFIVARGK